MSYVAIEEKLVELVTEITEIQVVYNRDAKELKDYPAATVTALGHENSFQSVGVGGGNNRMFSFAIRVFYPTSSEDVDGIIRDIADKVIVKLESNVKAEGVWDIMRPTRARFFYPERETPLLASEITVDIQKYVLR